MRAGEATADDAAEVLAFVRAKAEFDRVSRAFSA